MSSFFNKIGNKEAPMEMAEAWRWVNTHLATWAVNAVLDGEDRGETLADVEDYENIDMIWDFESGRWYYLDGSL